MKINKMNLVEDTYVSPSTKTIILNAEGVLCGSGWGEPNYAGDPMGEENLGDL